MVENSLPCFYFYAILILNPLMLVSDMTTNANKLVYVMVRTGLPNGETRYQPGDIVTMDTQELHRLNRSDQYKYCVYYDPNQNKQNEWARLSKGHLYIGAR